MNTNTRQTTWMFQSTPSVLFICLAVCAVVLLPAWSRVAVAQSTQPALVSASGGETSSAAVPKKITGKQVGVITGDNVYVRSGFSTGYYPVTKLNRGTEVVVVDREFGWLKILPPAGTHSLVDKTYIDVLDKKTGVANGRVWVYAGSTIDKRRYAKQVKLEKGNRVEIIGETAEGDFYKVVPPAGAHVWVSGDFVDLTGKTARAGRPTPKGFEPVRPGDLKLTQKSLPSEKAVPDSPASDRKDATDASGRAAKTVTGQATPAASADRSSSLSSAFTGKYQVMIDAIQAEIAAESSRPLTERNFEPLLLKLEAVADQTEDEVAQLYAQTRMKQLRDHMEVIAAVREMRDLRENAVSKADEAARRRELIRARSIPPMDTIAVRGEIRVSGIYDGSGSRPKRWRVVDTADNRTLAYIEVSEGSPIDPVQYYGKYVGIRASERRLLRGTIPPAPIYTVEEIQVLDPAAPSATPNSEGRERSPWRERGALQASPAAVTQPAATATEPPATAPAAG